MERQSSLYITKQDWMNDIGQYKQKAGEYIEKLNGYLANKNVDTVVSYIKFFQDRQVLEHYTGCSTDLAYAYIFAVVSVDEINKRGGVRFVFAGNSVLELVAKFKEIEFALWENEFEIDGAAVRLWELISVPFVTPELLKAAIFVSSIDKKKMFELVADVYKINGAAEYSNDMLLYGSN